MDASEEVFVTADSVIYPQLINLVWKNSLGGFSSFQFVSNIEKGKTTARSYYKNEDSKSKILSISTSDFIIAETKLHLRTATLEYLIDILDSEQVFWQRGTNDFVEVCVKTESGTSEKNSGIVPFSIEFEY